MRISNVFQIRYTFGQVVATLAMIETPVLTTIAIDSPESDETEKPLLSDQKDNKNTSALQPELVLLKTKPITSNFCLAMKHLRAQAGPWARFRGLQVFILYNVMYMVLFNLVSALVGRTMVPRQVAAVITSLALCRWDLLWTHVVISAPSQQPWFRRVPEFSKVKNIMIPAVVFAITEQVSIYVPTELFGIFGLSAYAQNPQLLAQASGEVQRKVVVQSFFLALVSLVIGFLVLLPASVTLTRVQASMLPEEEESIVPFDRTFNDRVVPKSNGGSGAVSMLVAWGSFDFSSRIRMVRLFTKIFLLETATTILFLVLGAVELKLSLPKSSGSL